MTVMVQPLLLDSMQVAMALSCAEADVEQLVAAGVLRRVRVVAGGEARFRAEDVAAVLDQLGEDGPLPSRRPRGAAL